MSRPVIICGRAARNWGMDMARVLGAEVADVAVRHFADGEMEVEVAADVAGAPAWVVQSCASPVQESVMELMLLVDGARRAGAGRVTAVVPYFAYARQDRQVRPGVAVSAEVVGRMLAAAGADAVATVDIHSPAALAFLGAAGRDVSVMGELARAAAQALQGEALCVVAPDAGGMQRAQAFAADLERQGCGPVPVVMVDKRRSGPNQVASATLVGEVAGRHCVLVDDMIDTAGTLCAAADALQAGGARAVSAAAVHGLFSGTAVGRLLGQGFNQLWVADTLPLREEVRALRALRVVPVAAAVAAAVAR